MSLLSEPTMPTQPSHIKSICELYAEAEHERVVLWCDPSCGYRGIIAIHSTTLGPAVGGTRFWKYECEKEASVDALRLSKAMSYKNALAGLPFGGGKAVIFQTDEGADREQIFRAHGRFVESLGGQFITAEDIGTRPADMEFVRQETRWVAGLPKGSSGYHLAAQIFEAGAGIVASDIDESRLKRIVREFKATAVSPDEIYSADVDIFSPCAFGGVVNEKTIPRLKAEIVVGSANNQLLSDDCGDELERRGILYAPDCIANSGGMLNGCRELL